MSQKQTSTRISDSEYVNKLKFVYDEGIAKMPSNATPISFEDFVYKEVSKKVIEVLSNKLSTVDRIPIWDEATKRLYRLLTKYFCGLKSFEDEYYTTKGGQKIKYKLRKGLLLKGDKGRGKSYSMDFIFPKITSILGINKYITFTSKSFTSDVKEFGNRAMRKFEIYNVPKDKGDISYREKDIYIDEIGAEVKTVLNFGNRYSPILDILDERYRIFQKIGTRTHISTNLELNEFRTEYDERIYSRLFEMFNIIDLRGDDLRIESME